MISFTGINCTQYTYLLYTSSCMPVCILLTIHDTHNHVLYIYEYEAYYTEHAQCDTNFLRFYIPFNNFNYNNVACVLKCSAYPASRHAGCLPGLHLLPVDVVSLCVILALLGAEVLQLKLCQLWRRQRYSCCFSRLSYYCKGH